MSADSRPCGGDAYRPLTYPTATSGDVSASCRQCTLRPSWGGKCLGSDGYAFFLPVAVEVAGERRDILGQIARASDAHDNDRSGYLGCSGTSHITGMAEEVVRDWWNAP
jgi:hypothetical protein